MATYTELKTKASASGTEQKKKLRQAVTIGVAGVLGTLAFLLVTYWTYNAVYTGGTTMEAARERVVPRYQKVVIRTAECPGQVQPVELDSAWRILNPGKKCRIIHNFSKHPVVQFADGDATPFDARGHVGINPDRARSKGTKVSGHYSLCPLETGLKPLNWDCSPL